MNTSRKRRMHGTCFWYPVIRSSLVFVYSTCMVVSWMFVFVDDDAICGLRDITIEENDARFLASEK